MKLSYFICVLFLFVFFLSSTVGAQEKMNPLEGTTWEKVSGEATFGDSTFTSPQSNYDRAIIVYGKTHFAYVGQDTSRKSSNSFAGTYIYKGDRCTYTLTMYPYYEDIGHSFTLKVQIEGDKMVITGADLHFYGRDWKTYREVYKRLD